MNHFAVYVGTRNEDTALMIFRQLENFQKGREEKREKQDK